MFTNRFFALRFNISHILTITRYQCKKKSAIQTPAIPPPPKKKRDKTLLSHLFISLTILIGLRQSIFTVKNKQKQENRLKER